MSQQVRIIVDKQGQLTVKAEGYPGVTCKDATKVFESLGTTLSSTPTSEMYAQDQIQTIQIVGTND
jgi:hypothetical protein